MLVGVSETCDAANPVPKSFTIKGLVPISDWNICKIPLRLPTSCGLKVTISVQAAPGAKDEPQVFVWL